MDFEIIYNVKKIRENKGLSLRQLADKCDISHSAIYYIENGTRKPTLDILIRIAEALGVEVSDLYTYRKL